MLNGEKALEASDVLDIEEDTNGDKLQQDDAIYCTVKSEEVPPIPENKFLMRNAVPIATTSGSTPAIVGHVTASATAISLSAEKASKPSDDLRNRSARDDKM